MRIERRKKTKKKNGEFEISSSETNHTTSLRSETNRACLAPSLRGMEGCCFGALRAINWRGKKEPSQTIVYRGEESALLRDGFDIHGAELGQVVVSAHESSDDEVFHSTY